MSITSSPVDTAGPGQEAYLNPSKSKSSSRHTFVPVSAWVKVDSVGRVHLHLLAHLNWDERGPSTARTHWVAQALASRYAGRHPASRAQDQGRRAYQERDASGIRPGHPGAVRRSRPTSAFGGHMYVLWPSLSYKTDSSSASLPVGSSNRGRTRWMGSSVEETRRILSGQRSFPATMAR
jgi:hypothetical protein